MEESWIWELGIGVLLFGLSYIDIKKKEIPLWGIALMVPFSIFAGKLTEKESSVFLYVIGGLLAGFIVLFATAVTRGGIGVGDGLIVCVLGLGLGFINVLFVFLIALFLAAVFFGILLLLHKCGWKSSWPFVPFLFLGYIGVVLCR